MGGRTRDFSMVAVAGGIHGMEALEQRMRTLEVAVRLIPEDLVENWGNVREAIKQMNQRIMSVQDVVDTSDTETKVMIADMKEAQLKEKESLIKYHDKVEQTENAVRTAEKMINEVNAATNNIRKCFAEDLKVLHKQMGERAVGGDDHKGDRQWNEKVKRADFNKPLKWGDSKKDYSFERFRAAIKRWGQKLHDDFSKILIAVEAGEESREWSAEDFQGETEIEEDEFEKINDALYELLDEVVDEDSSAKGYIDDEDVRNGFKAWRSLNGRYDAKKSADRESEYQRILDPRRYIGKAKTSEGALDMLTKWEGNIRRYERRFDRKVDEDTIKVKVKDIMPDSLFGEQGPFRGKSFNNWGDAQPNYQIPRRQTNNQERR